jgi:hypothetical protein
MQYNTLQKAVATALVSHNLREVWRALPSTKRPNPAPVAPVRHVGAADIRTILLPCRIKRQIMYIFFKLYFFIGIFK